MLSIAQDPGAIESAGLLVYSADLISVIDMNGVVRYANPAHETMYRRSVDEIVGRSVFELVAPDDVAKLREILEETLASPGKSVRGTARTTADCGSRVLEFAATNRVDDEAIAGFVVNAQDVTERIETLERLETLLRETISAFSTLIEYRDPYTAGHQRRVARLATAVAVHLGLCPDDVDGIGVAATIHDIGKIAIPAEILARPARLSVAERALVEVHAQVGADIVGRVPFPWPVAELILQHHERMDGSGYPRGLRGEEILLGARIIAAADTVEAVASHRPYRPGLGIERALEVLEEGRRTKFDAGVVDACFHLIRNEGFRFEE